MEDWTIRAIVRSELRIPYLLPAGAIVQTSAYLKKQLHTDRQFLVIPERNSGMAIRVPASNLLPLGEVFQRQPVHDFWFLMHLKSFASGKSDCFLSDPRRIKLGPLPFQFESEGELVYFMRHYDLQFPAFLISHAEHRPNRPDWFKP